MHREEGEVYILKPGDEDQQPPPGIPPSPRKTKIWLLRIAILMMAIALGIGCWFLLDQIVSKPDSTTNIPDLVSSTSGNANPYVIIAICVIVLLIILYRSLRAKARGEGQARVQAVEEALVVGERRPLYGRILGWVRYPIGPVGQFLALNSVRKIGVIILVLALLHLLIWSSWMLSWESYWGNKTLFWISNLGVILIGWILTSGIMSSTTAKRVSILFGTILCFSVGYHFFGMAAVKTWTESIKWNSTPTTPVAKVELPRGTLKCEPGPDVLAIRPDWPKVYLLNARNVLISKDEFNFDIWHDNLGKCGEYRWKKKYQINVGTYSRCYPEGKGEWFLGCIKTDEYEGWYNWMEAGKEFRVPMKFFVER